MCIADRVATLSLHSSCVVCESVCVCDTLIPGRLNQVFPVSFDPIFDYVGLLSVTAVCFQILHSRPQCITTSYKNTTHFAGFDDILQASQLLLKGNIVILLFDDVILA